MKKTELDRWPKKPCRYCGLLGHYPYQCYSVQRKPMKIESDEHRRRRGRTASQWFKNKHNQPDENGQWTCYLQISAFCPKKLTRDLITLEHVWPKKSYPHLRFTIKNIKPACAFCNKMKGSRTIVQLAKAFPHIAAMMETLEWQAWQARLDRYVERQKAKGLIDDRL